MGTDMRKILIINGPNLNLTGRREPDIYGIETMEGCLEQLRAEFSGSVCIDYIQSNHEGVLIDALHDAYIRGGYMGVVLNAGAYTHTSLALADAVAAIDIPVVEVHISNIFAREIVRHTSFISPHCLGVIVGMGMRGYSLAIKALLDTER